MRAALSAGLAILCCLAGSRAAWAATDDCGKSTRRWVAVRLHGAGLSKQAADAVLADLRAEMGRHGLDACLADTQGLPAPIVTLDIEASEPSVVHLSLDITDPVTGRASARNLQLESLPPDGHSLAVAVAADELLTSSWIKLASRPLDEATAPPPVRPATPAEVVAGAAVVAPRQPAGTRHELGLLAAA